MAELAFVGSGVNQYQIWIGGSPNLERLAKPIIQKMHIDELEETLEPFFLSWKQDDSNISFGDHVAKMNQQSIMALLPGSSTEP